jgi:iron(III) transport system substrate-binding protein
MIKFSLASILLFSTFFLFSSCATNSSNKKRIVIYSPHGKEMLSEFKILYEKEHPDVDVEWLDMGSQEVFDRLSTESSNPQADIWWGAPTTIFMRAEKMGLLQKYKPSWADQVPTSAKSTGDFWYGTFSTPEVIAFNDNRLSKEKAPKDWNDIVSPEWRGKIVLRNPLASGTLRVIFSAMLANSVRETGNEERGWEWLRKLDSNISIYAADPTQMYGKLGEKNEAVTLWNMPDIILQKREYNFPFGYNFPLSGTVVLTDAIAIVGGCKNPVEARDFYEFVTTKKSLLLQAAKYYRIPSRIDIPKTDLPEWLNSADYKVLNVDWNLIAEKEASWMKKWNTDIKSK